MKVQKNITIFSGAEPGSEHIVAQRAGKEGTVQKESIYFAGNIGQQGSLRDRIALRMQEAQKKAMKVVGDVWNSERVIDEDLQERRDRVTRLLQENKELQGQVSELEEEQSVLQERYGVTDDSKEQKDLELLREYRKMKTGRGGSLTKEEYEYVSKRELEGLTDYQQQQLDLDESKYYYQDIIGENDTNIKNQNATIQAIRRERLKSSPMVKAQKEADKIMEAASNEAIGMVVEDAKDHIDEEHEKREEKVKEVEEEREEIEELREKQKEHKEDWEEFLENLPTEELLSLEKCGKDIQQEVQDIMNKMKLIAEDMKGVKVDESL